ncbi:MAG: phage tail assembly chaperone [Pseudomonadota bacterium]
MAEPLAWAALMRIGIGRLGLQPEQFWALTPTEFALLAGLATDGSARMTRTALAALEDRIARQRFEKEQDG